MNSDLMNALPSKYRPDIDGLRAIAVLSVVGFHAFPDWIKGGFIGVDVFFVISGFLISTILFEHLEKDTFILSEFYGRRIKRIFPSLILVLTVCFILGWFILFPNEYKQLGKHIVGGAGFFSNIMFWHEAGYFDNAADTKPLLHLWSLGIEEQFYIVWPIVLWAAWKLKCNLLLISVLVACMSFYLNIRGVNQDSIATFYSPQTRIWELLSGSILAWLTLFKSHFRFRLIREIDNSDNIEYKDRNIEKNLMAILGFILILFGLYTITKDAYFPGIMALFPTLGAVLIIAGGAQAWINRTLLSSRVLVWLGIISFPLYLWHWPLLSFARIIEGGTPGNHIRAGVVILAIFLGWLTYWLIERPIRFGRKGKMKIILLLLLMSIIGYVGNKTFELDGLGFRNQDRDEFVSYFESSFPTWKYYKKIGLSKWWRNECAYFNEKKYFAEGHLDGGVINSKPKVQLDESCYVKDNKHNKTIMIWGDSHAQALAPGIVNNIPKDWQVLQVASSGCTPNPDIVSPSTDSQCNQSNYFAMKTIKEVIPDVVVVAQADGHNSKDIKMIVSRLKKTGIKRVLYLGSTPQWTSELPKLLVRKLRFKIPRRTYAGINHNIVNNNNQLHNELKSVDSVEFVNIIDFFCNKKGCLTYTGNDVKTGITTWDYGHLTPSASNYLAKNMLIDKIIGK